MRVAFLGLQLFDGFATTGENVKGALPRIFRAAGFEEVRECGTLSTMFGTLALYSARRGSDAGRDPILAGGRQ